MEKVLKTLEGLRMPSLPSFDSSIPGNISSAMVAAGDAVKTKNKERIGHCIAVTDAVCSHGTQNLSEYPKILEGVTEVLFQLCNDPDADIRLVATDCLHRIVRSVKDQMQHRLQMEIYKEIKKNQQPRSLRVAIKLFAFMSPLIRPQKSRVFMASLLPCFTQIAKRTEESLYEHLSPAMGDIFKNLGAFINDNEVKILSKDFLVNLESPSVIIRRSSASILVDLCRYSRKPHVFLPKLLSQLIEMVNPGLMEKSVATLIGTLLCIRQCIEPLSEQLKLNFEKKSPDLEVVIQNLLQVYEMCMLLCNHDDHNVVTTALDVLQQLLSHPFERLIQRLVAPTGIQNSLNGAKCSVGSSESVHISSSRCSLAFSDAANMLEGDADVPTFRNFLSSTCSEVREEAVFTFSLPGSRRNSDVFDSEAPLAESVLENQMDYMQSDDETQERRISLSIHNFPEIQIGSLYEENIPLRFCARFLAYNFLLSGRSGMQKSDKEIRISVKVLALNCLMNVLNISPDIFHLPLSCSEDDSDGQTMQEILLYVKHQDPLLRGSTYILIGNLITSFIRSYSSGQMDKVESDTMMKLVSLLVEAITDSSPTYDTSNVGIKCAITALGKCITPFFRSQFNKDTKLVDALVNALLSTASNPYWLVKVDVIELLASIEWKLVKNSTAREGEVLSVFSCLLSDEDPRVRSAAASSLLKFVSLGNPVEEKEYVSLLFCESCVLGQLYTPLKNCDCLELRDPVDSRLELVLNMLRDRVSRMEDKNAMVGTYLALSSLSEKYPPKLFEVLWHCENANEIPVLFHMVLDTLRSSPLIHDTIVHQNLLSLACNLFLGLISNAVLKKDMKTEGNVFAHPSKHVCAAGVLIVHHCISVLKIYQGVIEGHAASQNTAKKQATSPTVSPVKKIAQKLESDKKPGSADTESERKLKNLVYVVPSCPAHLKKIRDALTLSWKLFKSSLDSNISNKFTSLMEAAFVTLSKIFDHIQADFTGLATLIDEILAVSSSVFYLCPNSVLVCVQQMLRCLFKLRDTGSRVLEGKYHTLHDVTTTNSIQNMLHFTTTFHKTFLSERNVAAVKSPAEKSILSGFIRQFEPVVVTALRVYTTSSNVIIQSHVLQLLSCLIKGHVNYGLVDKSQVFLGFVIKQIGFLEEGHIRNNGQLVEEMFEFLTLLTHEQHHQTAKFIDIPKVLRLCDGLVASGQNPVTHCLPALKKIVYDLYIERSQLAGTITERKEIEAQREVLLQMLVKLMFVPEALVIIWMILEARQGTNEAKWREDSKLTLSVLLPLIENGDLVISEKHHFCSLAALLFSMNSDSIPSKVTLETTLVEAIKLSEHIKQGDFMAWQLHLVVHWLLVVKSAAIINYDLVMRVIQTHATVLSTVLESACFLNHREFAVFVAEIFIEAVEFYLRKHKKVLNRSTGILQGAGPLEMLSSTINSLRGLSLILPSIYLRFGRVLIHLPDVSTTVWDHYLRSSNVPTQLPFVMKQLLQNTHHNQGSDLLFWLLKNYFLEVSPYVDKVHAIIAISERSDELVLEILAQLDKVLEEPANVKDVNVARNILRILRGTCAHFPFQMGLRAIELLNSVEEPHLKLEISHWTCQIFSSLRSPSEREAIRNCQVLSDFLALTANSARYPRLHMVIEKIMLPEVSEPKSIIQVTSVESAVAAWCCAELNAQEGPAIARLLGTFTYNQIISILSQERFNVQLISYCFTWLGTELLQGDVTVDELWDLFVTEKRSDQINKLPLGVAIFEYVIDLLDKWEIVADKLSKGLQHELKCLENLPDLWKVLENMLRLKVLLTQVGGAVPQSCRNNFIPTKIFTFSFEVLEANGKASSGRFLTTAEDFFSFAGLALEDATFMKFFNTEEEDLVLRCVQSFGTVVRLLSKLCGVYERFIADDCQLDPDEPRKREALFELHYSLELICSVEGLSSRLEPGFNRALRNVLAGLGRCDAVNMHILTGHLDWTPRTENNEFGSSMYHLPLEIFQNDDSLLRQYVKKLHILGISNKVQFEENWILFLSVINSYADENFSLPVVCTGLRSLTLMLEQTVRFIYLPKTSVSKIRGFDKVLLAINRLEPDFCKSCQLPIPLVDTIRKTENPYEVDFNSCIRFLIDLFSQWLQNPQGKMPLLLLSEVVQSIVRMAEYFEEVQQYSWMFETLVEVHKSFEKEDELLWPHLLYGIFYAGSKLSLDQDTVNYLVQVLEGTLTSTYVNVSMAGLQGGLVFLQHHPDSYPVINIIAPYVLKNTHLAEIEQDSESHSLATWKTLLFLWVYGPSDSAGLASFEQETLSNILTVLSPLNKVHVSIRILALKSLQAKIMQKNLNWEAKRSIAKMMSDSMKTKNICVFFESLKLFAAVFYTDFEDLFNGNPDPEMLMQMAERTETLFKLVKNGLKYNSAVVGKLLPQMMCDFLPPSEILNRVIAEFLNPQQTYPELLAPLVTQLLEKARRRPREAALVREWIVSSIPNFLSNPDFSRTSWSITIFFIGVSSQNDILNLLPFSELRRTAWSKDLFVLSALDFYRSLSQSEQAEFIKSLKNGPATAIGSNPYDFLVNVLENLPNL